MNLKKLRDKINDYEPLADGETKEMLIEQWKNIHIELEAKKSEDERNYVSCEDEK